MNPVNSSSVALKVDAGLPLSDAACCSALEVTCRILASLRSSMPPMVSGKSLFLTAVLMPAAEAYVV